MWPSCRNRNASRMCARARALRRMEDSARQGRHAHRDEIAGRPVMTPIPAVVPPLPRERTWKRNVAPAAALDWLSAGWRDFTTHPGASISYGLVLFLLPASPFAAIFAPPRDHIFPPGFAFFRVVGPVMELEL